MLLHHSKLNVKGGIPIEKEAKSLLFKRLDENLKRWANEYMEPRDENGQPFVKNLYILQGFIETHIYLKTEHEFTPGEINDLLTFADPLAVANHCWEENEDKYCFRISDLIDKHHLRDLYPPADVGTPAEEKRPSLREQLDEAKRQVRSSLPRQIPNKGNRGSDAR